MGSAPGGDTSAVAVELRADVRIENLDAFIADPGHHGAIAGVLAFQGLGTFAANGAIELFPPDAILRGLRMSYLLRYEIGTVAYTLDGTKHVRHASGFGVWRDVTELYTAVWRLDSEPVTVMAGKLKLSLWQGVRLLFSLRGIGDRWSVRIRSVFRFAIFFVSCALRQALGIRS